MSEELQQRIEKQRRKNKRLRKKWEKDPKQYDAEYSRAILDLHNLRNEEVGNPKRW